MRVSVVIPAYNAARFVGAAIASARAQTYRPFEIVVVDDGSTDDTAVVVRSFGDEVRYVHQKNARQAAARNTGIRQSYGELLAFLDADDVWRNDKIERQVERLAARPELGLVYCSLIETDENGREGAYRQARLGPDAARQILLGEAGGGICGSSLVVPRRVLEDVGLFDEALSPCEETELLWRIACRHPVDFVDEPLVRYRLHAGNDHRNVDKMARAWKGFYRKALRQPETQREGWAFRRRCRARLYYMLAGDYARAGRFWTAVGYGLRALVAWPPRLGPLLLAARRSRRP